MARLRSDKKIAQTNTDKPNAQTTTQISLEKKKKKSEYLAPYPPSINILGCTCSSKSLTSLLSSIRLIFQRNFRTVAATWLRSDPHQIFYFVSHIVARLFIYLFIFIFIFFILQHCVSRVNTIELCGW